MREVPDLPGPVSELVKRAERFAREQLAGDSTGHDWWHVDRVRRNALRIAESEGANLQVCELAALLHDVGDHKFQGGDKNASERLVADFLEQSRFPAELAARVRQVVSETSFGSGRKPTSIEAACVQDADRLDTLGAIGIARCFATGAVLKQPIHDPSVSVAAHTSSEDYREAQQAGTGTSFNHFFEKVLGVKDRMNTITGRALAEEPHRYLEEYVRRFLDEWNGKF